RRSLMPATLPIHDDADLISAPDIQPSGRSIGAIFGPCIEGNCCAWGRLMNGVDDGFECCNAPGLVGGRQLLSQHNHSSSKPTDAAPSVQRFHQARERAWKKAFNEVQP